MSVSTYIVRRWMTPAPDTIGPEATLDEARLCMDEGNYRHLPVVDDLHVVGIISDRDLRSALSSPEEFNLDIDDDLDAEPPTVAAVMCQNPIVVSPNTPVAKAARLLIDLQIGALPVVDKGEIVGIFSEVDGLQALISALTYLKETMRHEGRDGDIDLPEALGKAGIVGAMAFADFDDDCDDFDDDLDEEDATGIDDERGDRDGAAGGGGDIEGPDEIDDFETIEDLAGEDEPTREDEFDDDELDDDDDDDDDFDDDEDDDDDEDEDDGDDGLDDDEDEDEDEEDDELDEDDDDEESGGLDEDDDEGGDELDEDDDDEGDDELDEDDDDEGDDGLDEDDDDEGDDELDDDDDDEGDDEDDEDDDDDDDLDDDDVPGDDHPDDDLF